MALAGCSAGRGARPARSAGAFSRALALALDAGIVYGSLLLISAAIAALIGAFTTGDEHAGTVVVAFGFLTWSLIAR